MQAQIDAIRRLLGDEGAFSLKARRAIESDERAGLASLPKPSAPEQMFDVDAIEESENMRA